MRQGDALLSARPVARKPVPFNAVRVGEVLAIDGGRVSAPLDVDEQQSRAGAAFGLVTHVHPGALVKVRGATLAARRHRALHEAIALFAPDGGAGDGRGREVSREGGQRRVDIKGHEEEQGSAAGRRERRQHGGATARRLVADPRGSARGGHRGGAPAHQQLGTAAAHLSAVAALWLGGVSRRRHRRTDDDDDVDDECDGARHLDDETAHLKSN